MATMMVGWLYLSVSLCECVFVEAAESEANITANLHMYACQNLNIIIIKISANIIQWGCI